MDAKSAKKNGDGKKVNRDDRQSGVKVEELAEKVSTIFQLEYVNGRIACKISKWIFLFCRAFSLISC